MNVNLAMGSIHEAIVFQDVNLVQDFLLINPSCANDERR
jgi:hypothetical protein